MKIIYSIDEAINHHLLTPGSIAYLHGSASTPHVICQQLVQDTSIVDLTLISGLPIGDISALFSESVCQRITHKVYFNSGNSRAAQNKGWAEYLIMHLSDIPRQIREYLKPNIVFCSIAGPDNAGNYSLGTTTIGIQAAIETVKANGGLVIAERNKHTPFILGNMITSQDIDYLIDTDYPLPTSPLSPLDEKSERIARIIAECYIKDGVTLQYGIGKIPSAVTNIIIEKGYQDLGIHTEVFNDAMRVLIEKGIVNNRFTTMKGTTTAAIFQSADQAGYDWMNYNSAILSRPSDYTNSALNIAKQPHMRAINTAIGVDLYGNIWADSLESHSVYSGVGGQCDFLRGARLSPGGIPIIAMESTTSKGISKIGKECPQGITTTAIAPDPVVLVTEHGALNPNGLTYVEKAVGIAHLAAPEHRTELLKHLYDHPEFHTPKVALRNGHPKGFIPYESL